MKRLFCFDDDCWDLKTGDLWKVTGKRMDGWMDLLLTAYSSAHLLWCGRCWPIAAGLSSSGWRCHQSGRPTAGPESDPATGCSCGSSAGLKANISQLRACVGVRVFAFSLSEISERTRVWFTHRCSETGFILISGDYVEICINQAVCVCVCVLYLLLECCCPGECRRHTAQTESHTTVWPRSLRTAPPPVSFSFFLSVRHSN